MEETQPFENMEFTYNSVKYKANMTALQIYRTDAIIRLPEGKYVEVTVWRESLPPVPLTISGVFSLSKILTHPVAAEASYCER